MHIFLKCVIQCGGYISMDYVKYIFQGQIWLYNILNRLIYNCKYILAGSVWIWSRDCRFCLESISLQEQLLEDLRDFLSCGRSRFLCAPVRLPGGYSQFSDRFRRACVWLFSMSIICLTGWWWVFWTVWGRQFRICYCLCRTQKNKKVKESAWQNLTGMV